jgi:predicted Zn-dependent protease with MMP-like domain
LRQAYDRAAVTVTDARRAADKMLAELPQQVHDALEHVSMRVVDHPPAGVPSDVKGIFLGRQQVGPPDDAEDDDGDAGEWYDVGAGGDLELVGVGGGLLAEGVIYLVARNLADAGDLESVAYHEIAHALGESEEGTAALGL